MELGSRVEHGGFGNAIMSKSHEFDAVIEYSPSEARVYRQPGTSGELLTDWKVLEGQRILVAMSRRSSFIRATRVPSASKEDVRQALTVSAGEVLPLPSAEVAFDFLLTNDVNTHGRLALVAAIRLSDLEVLTQKLSEANVRSFQILPAAVGSALLADQQGMKNVAVVGPCLGGFGIDLIQGGILRSSRLVNGDSTPEALIDEVSRTFKANDMTQSETLSVGGLQLLEATAKTGTGSLDPLFDLRSDTIDLNIELNEKRAQRLTAETSKRQRFALLTCVAAIAAVGFTFLQKADEAKALSSQKSLQSSKLRSAKSRLSLEESQLDEVKEKLDITERGLNPAQQLGDVVTLIGNMAPEKVWLTGITAERGKPIQIRGTAMEAAAVTEFLKRLSKEPRFRDVQLTFANNADINKKPVVQFALTAFPIGNLPLVEQETKKK